MLKVRVSIRDVQRAPESPSVSLLTLAGVTLGSCYDLIKITPSNDTFYLYLPAAHSGKPARSTPSLLPAKHPRPAQWKQAATRLLEYQPVNGALFSDSILQMITYETVSNPIPMDSVGGICEKPLGELEQYALENNPDLVRQDELSALNTLGFDTLATVRVGCARIGILSLAKEAFAASPKAQLSIPLLDATDNPTTRGFIDLDVELVKTISAQESGISSEIEVPPLSADLVEALQSQQPVYTLEYYKKLVEQSKAIVYREFVNAYVRAFPPLPSEKAAIGRSALESISKGVESAASEFMAINSNPKGKGNVGYQIVQKAIANEEVKLRSRLLATSENITTMHAPIVSINGDPHVPIGFYYKQPINPNFISEHHHEHYFGSILETVCQLFGTSTESFAMAIHQELRNKDDQQSSLYKPTLEMMACVRILGFFLTHLNTTFRYRADFALGRGRNGDPGSLQVREDTSQDLLLGMNSEDCDGLENAVHAVCFIIWTGIQTLTNPWLTKDRVFRCIQESVHPTKKFGGWKNEGLNAIQRMLFYYTPMSIVGGTTASFPAADAAVTSASSPASQSSPPQSISLAAHGITTMEGLTEYSSSESRKFYLKTNQIEDLECHRWGIMVPIQTVVHSLVTCFDSEDSDGTIRYETDQELVNRLRKLHEALIQLAPLPCIPPILIEATVPTNPLALFSASAWIKGQPDPYNYIKRVQRSESVMRDLSLHNKASESSLGAMVEDDTWYPRGVMTVDEGIAQWQPADDPNRNASLFYKMLTCGDIPFFNELFDTTDFTCAFLTNDCSSFGVDVETVMGRYPAKYGLMMPLHRIPIGIREEAKKIGKQTVEWRLPTQFGAYPGLNVQMPKPKPVDVVLEQGVPSEICGFRITPIMDSNAAFSRTLAVANLNIISPQHLEEFERMLEDRGAKRIIKIEEKLQPYGPRVAVYSFEPPNL